MSLCRNKKQTAKVSECDCSSLVKSDISNQYTVPVRKGFDTSQETSERHTPNDEYERKGEAWRKREILWTDGVKLEADRSVHLIIVVSLSWNPST